MPSVAYELWLASNVPDGELIIQVVDGAVAGTCGPSAGLSEFMTSIGDDPDRLPLLRLDRDQPSLVVAQWVRSGRAPFSGFELVRSVDEDVELEELGRRAQRDERPRKWVERRKEAQALAWWAGTVWAQVLVAMLAWMFIFASDEAGRTQFGDSAGDGAAWVWLSVLATAVIASALPARFRT